MGLYYKKQINFNLLNLRDLVNLKSISYKFINL